MSEGIRGVSPLRLTGAREQGGRGCFQDKRGDTDKVNKSKPETKAKEGYKRKTHVLLARDR